MSEAQQPNQPQPTGPPPPGPPPQQPSPTQVVPPVKQKRFGLALILLVVLAAVLALLAGIGIGAWGGAGWTAAPAPTVTVTETIGAPVEGGGAPTEEPTQEPEPEPTTEAPAAYNPKPKDFKIGIKILKKTCYETLPCDVQFRIVPSYIGSQEFPNEGTTEVKYEVTGGEQDITNTFEVDGEGTVTFDDFESAKTASSSTMLVANVTEVSYNRFG